MPDRGSASDHLTRFGNGSPCRPEPREHDKICQRTTQKVGCPPYFFGRILLPRVSNAGAEPQDSGDRGKNVARARLSAADFTPSPGGWGKGGLFGSPHFHEQLQPRRGIRLPEPGDNSPNFLRGLRP